MAKENRSEKSQRRPDPVLNIAIVLLALAVVALIAAVVIVTKNKDSTSAESGYHAQITQNLEQQETISKQLISAFVPKNIRDNLRWIAEKVHVAGTPENTALMYRLADQYRQYGYHVKTIEYEVLLSYPDYDHPNTIDVKTATGWQQLSNGISEPLGPKEALEQESDPRMLVWWNAYSAHGTAEGQIVYANYGSFDDYALLDQHGVNLAGKIVLCRFGNVWRGSKVVGAAKRGAIGVVIYSDPADYAGAASDEKSDQMFPDQIWMPPSGAQRGTLSFIEGDPETPFFPSKNYTFRTETLASLRAAYLIPKVPVTPIGYRDAIKIMSRLDGQEVLGMPGWRGGMNTVYRLNGSATFRLSVRSSLERRKIVNFIATMQGTEEPDRHVLLGNHVDAWVKGSVDPGSGTATIVEMARVLASVANSTGWRPRRSIVFCHWDAEEYKTIGSTEHVEEFLRPLEVRAVAYINVDMLWGNMSLSTKASSLLYRSVVDAAQKVPNPNMAEFNVGRKTVYDSWKYYNPEGPIAGDPTLPFVSHPDSGTDIERFINYAGIPVVDLMYDSAPKLTRTLYHTMYEIPWMVENLIDTHFSTYTAVGQVMLEIGRSLADSLIVPFNVADYGYLLTNAVNKMEKQLISSGINTAIGNDEFVRMLTNLRDAIARFQLIADDLQSIVAAVQSGKRIITIRQSEMLNSRLVALERSFVCDQGIYAERAFYRHVIFTISRHDMYAGVTLAVITDPAIDLRTALNAGQKDAAQHWLNTLKLGFTKVQYAIESAILLLDMEGFDD